MRIMNREDMQKALERSDYIQTILATIDWSEVIQMTVELFDDKEENTIHVLGSQQPLEEPKATMESVTITLLCKAGTQRFPRDEDGNLVEVIAL